MDSDAKKSRTFYHTPDMKLHFSKMHGLGNDFVVFNMIDQPLELSPAQLRFIANRHEGIGCDQILLVAPAISPDADFQYRIFNADGGEVEQCGNGARCFARFVREQGLSSKETLTVDTNNGRIQLRLMDDGLVAVNMGQPDFTPDNLPFEADAEALRYTLPIAEETISIGAVSVGNPHAVMMVENVDNAPVAELGPLIETHSRFPRGVNAGFMEILETDHIRLRVHERGVGETRACGTGACAAMAVGRRWGLLDASVAVELAGGTLHIEWDKPEDSQWMTGPTAHVFEGTLNL